MPNKFVFFLIFLKSVPGLPSAFLFSLFSVGRSFLESRKQVLRHLVETGDRTGRIGVS